MPFDATCPLCGGPATYKVVERPYRKHFACPVCVRFSIDASSEVHVAGLMPHERDKLSKAAKAAADAGHIFVMREPTDAERKAQPKPKLMMMAEPIEFT